MLINFNETCFLNILLFLFCIKKKSLFLLYKYNIIDQMEIFNVILLYLKFC